MASKTSGRASRADSRPAAVRARCIDLAEETPCLRIPAAEYLFGHSPCILPGGRSATKDGWARVRRCGSAPACIHVVLAFFGRSTAAYGSIALDTHRGGGVRWF